MDNNLRMVNPTPLNDFYQVSEEGKLDGPLGRIAAGSYDFFNKNFNGTYIVSKNLSIYEVISEGIADFTLYSMKILVGPNITYGPAFTYRSCLILTRPPIRFSSDSSGPETALFSTKLYLAIVILFLWSLLLSVILIDYRKRRRFNIIWIFIQTISRQSNHHQSHDSVRTILVFFLCSSFLLQIIYGSFLNTERTTMTSFDRIETTRDIIEKNMIPLRSPTSAGCFGVRDENFFQNSKQVPLSMAQLSSKRYKGTRECINPGKCALVLNSLEYNFFISFLCSLTSSLVLQHPIRISKPFDYEIIGVVMNKYVSKRKRDRLYHYASRSYEMGLFQVKAIGSMDTAIKLAPQPPSRECLDNKIKSRTSVPAALSIQFFGQVLVLYLVASMIAIILRIFKCLFSIRHAI